MSKAKRAAKKKVEPAKVEPANPAKVEPAPPPEPPPYLVSARHPKNPTRAELWAELRRERGKTTEIEERYEKTLEARVAALEEGFSKLDSDMDDMAGDLRAAERKVEDMASDVEEHGQTIDDVKGRVDDLERGR